MVGKGGISRDDNCVRAAAAKEKRKFRESGVTAAAPPCSRTYKYKRTLVKKR